MNKTVVITKMPKLSGKESTPSDYVPASITFTPPEQLEPMGFWDYFAEAVAKLFGSVGQ